MKTFDKILYCAVIVAPMFLLADLAAIFFWTSSYRAYYLPNYKIFDFLSIVIAAVGFFGGVILAGKGKIWWGLFSVATILFAIAGFVVGALWLNGGVQIGN